MNKLFAKILWKTIKNHVVISHWKSPTHLAIEFEVRIFGVLAHKTEITTHEILNKNCL